MRQQIQACMGSGQAHSHKEQHGMAPVVRCKAQCDCTSAMVARMWQGCTGLAMQSNSSQLVTARKYAGAGAEGHTQLPHPFRAASRHKRMTYIVMLQWLTPTECTPPPSQALHGHQSAIVPMHSPSVASLLRDAALSSRCRASSARPATKSPCATVTSARAALSSPRRARSWACSALFC